MFCRSCGKKITEDSKFCYFCGERQHATEINPIFVRIRHNRGNFQAFSRNREIIINLHAYIITSAPELKNKLKPMSCSDGYYGVASKIGAGSHCYDTSMDFAVKYLINNGFKRTVFPDGHIEYDNY